MASSSSAPIHVLGGVGFSTSSSKRTGSSSVRTVFLGQGLSNGRFGSLPRSAFLKINRFGGRRRSAGRPVHVVSEKVVGIDLGTTNSAVAAMEEVELLLSPEERAILQQNEAPDFSKIATIKWSPLHTLALSGQIPLMDKVIEFGIDIDAVDKDGYSALHKVVISKKEAVISHLLRKGASPHVRDRDGATPLHYAVQVGAMQTVKLLIKYKVDVNVADNEGWIPLHVAIQSQCRDIAKVLLVNGADKTRRNKDGKTPLDLSLCFGRDFKSYELAKLLKLVPADREA